MKISVPHVRDPFDPRSISTEHWLWIGTQITRMQATLINTDKISENQRPACAGSVLSAFHFYTTMLMDWNADNADAGNAD